MSLLLLFDSNSGKSSGKKKPDWYKIKKKEFELEMWSLSIEVFDKFYRKNYKVIYSDKDNILSEEIKSEIDDENDNILSFKIDKLKKRK
jgi:hypothetical protein